MPAEDAATAAAAAAAPTGDDSCIALSSKITIFDAFSAPRLLCLLPYCLFSLLIRRNSLGARDQSMGWIATEAISCPPRRARTTSPSRRSRRRRSLSRPFFLSSVRARARPPSISRHCKPGTAAFSAGPHLASTARSLALLTVAGQLVVSSAGSALTALAPCCERSRRRRRHEYCTVLPPRGRLKKCSLRCRATVTTAAATTADRQLKEQLSALYHLSLTHSFARSLTHSLRPTLV